MIDVLEILRTKSRLSAKFCSRDDEEASFLNNPWLDEHFESMITRLSGVTHRGTRVPIHFIGRIESLDRDWNRLLDALNVNLNHPARKPLAHVEHECAVPERANVISKPRATLSILTSSQGKEFLIGESFTSQSTCCTLAVVFP